MNHYFKTIFKPGLTALLCFGAMTAAAQLKIDGIGTWANAFDSGTVLTAEGESEPLYFEVYFDDTLQDFTITSILRPTLSFTIGNVSKTAEFTDINTLGVMTFIYYPTVDDYGTGLKIPASPIGSGRVIINIPTGLTIRNGGGTSILENRDQYLLSVATKFNTDTQLFPFPATSNQSIGLNMYAITNDEASISIKQGASSLITVRRPPIAVYNTTSISLGAVSTNSAVASVAPSSQTMVGGIPYCSFTVTGVTPGTTLVKISSSDHPAEYVVIPVTVAAVPSLQISSIQISTDDGDNICLSQTELLKFKVTLDNPVGSGESLALLGTSTEKPTFHFKLNGVDRVATYDRIGTGLNSAAIYFAYTPSPTDYGVGVTINGTLSVDDCIAIRIPANLSITDTTSGGILLGDGQYAPAFATSFNTTISAINAEVNMYKLELADPTLTSGVPINRGSSETVTVKRPDLAKDNLTDIALLGVSSNSAVATVAPSPQTMYGGNPAVNFIITGVAPGTTTVRIYSQAHPSEYVEFPVTVNLSGTERAIIFSPTEYLVPENAQSPRHWVRVTVGIAPAVDLVLNVTKSGANANRLICASTVTIAANTTSAWFPVDAPDGPVNAILTFADPGGNYVPGNFLMVVDNVEPSIVLPIPTLDPASGQLTASMTVVVGETLTLTAAASDPAGTNDVITYWWIYDNNGVQTTIYGRTASFVFDRDTTIVLNASDDDGGTAAPLYITITVETGVILTMTALDEPTLLGSGSGTFRYLDPSNRVWTVANPSQRFSELYQTAGVRVRAIPDPGSYLFTWLADDGILTPTAAYNMPTLVSDVTVKLEDATDVQHLFSREFYTGIDGFGDIDADGLSDRWEATWFGVDTSDNLGSTASTDPRGVNGAEGNADGDALPLAGLLAVPNIMAPGQVMVYQYPITDHGGDLWNWTGYLPNTNNPFTNIIEYRGLLENRGLGDGWVRYAMAMPVATSPLRGNDPATDPNLLDTDSDRMDDGWEYYFWTTIMYEVNTQNWRAFDPSFNFYNATNSSAAGLPLLRVGLPDQAITNALPNAYAFDGMGSSFAGTVTNLPVRPGTFTVTFDDGTVYTDDGKGRMLAMIGVNTLIDPVTYSPVPTSVQVLSVDYTTGVWIIVPPVGATATADYVISYEMLDGLYTKQQLLDAFDPAVRGGAQTDTDQDGLYDWEEFVLGTNPLHWDTDGDSMPDGWEVERGLDPLNGDRVLGNANGAIGNPDGDKMAGSHTTGIYHALVYIDALNNQTYWNGEAAFGFNPGLGWQEGNNDEPDFTNLDEFRVAEYYIFDLDLVDTVSPENWLQYTTNPCDNDTNGDGLPDGWALYVGLSPILPVPPRVIDVQLGPIGPIADDYDSDGLVTLAEFDCTGVVAFRTEDETVTINDVTALRRAFGNPNSDWTNKTRPTDPWNADTDGDGLSDGLEYREDIELDYNVDGSTLVNLNPTSVDTDGDWLPDGWEYYNGLQTTNNPGGDFNSPTGTYGDPDGDGLSNYQEYLAGVNYGWRYDKRYSPQDESLWLPGPVGNYLNPTDPTAISFRPYDAGDFLRPFASPASLQAGLELIESIEPTLSITPPAPEDPVYGYTYLELLQRTMVVMQDVGFFGLPGPVQIQVRAFEANIRQANFSYGLQPLSWDPALLAIGPPINMPYFFLKDQIPGLYATCNPRSIDSDSDGMEDYWEAFHGMNPIYGGDREPAESQEDRMLGSVGLNLAMSLTDRPMPMFGAFARAGKEVYRNYQLLAMWRPYGLAEPVGPDYYNQYWNTAIPYDLVNNPALSGCPWGDIDKDGLSSREEAYGLYAAAVLSHTDPSPYWITDISYNSSYVNGFDGAGSHVNNYYASGSLASIWWWNYAYDGVLRISPTYLFDFEINEGYDTDNDNISDREELTGTDSLGVTDPLDFDTPRSRKAMYFNGNAACRTRNPFFHDKWALTSYSVEMWFRAQEPVGNGYQTLIERPVVVPVDSTTSAWAIRRTFRLSVTPDGRLRAEMDNDALATFSVETKAANGRIAPNVWYHVAVTMDSQNNRFIIYLNGAMMASLACDIKPCTGYFAGLQIADYDPPAGSALDLALLDVRTFSPAPIVVGATDGHPSRVLAGPSNPEFTNFFKGWVDEIRIWDRVRSQGEIQSDMYKRYGLEEVAKVNDARYAWDQGNAIPATALTYFPQKILYHFSFDNLPDVIASPDRDPNAIIPGPATDPIPYGYDGIGPLARPPVTDYPGIPWWFSSPVKSTVYSADYTYVPIIENTAAHLRQYPPFDVKTLLPVFDANYNLMGYRWRKSEDWIATFDGLFAAFNPINTNALYDVDPAMIPNAANPYGFKYKTGIARFYEINPTRFSGEVGLLSRYEDVPIYTDMLPLLDAVADVDVEMWDGKGAGSNFAALDTDGDGLPDWWETANGLDPYDADGENGAYGDPDGDGLDNWGEYLAGTNPFAYDTNGDGYSDYDSRDDNQSLTYGEMYDDNDGMPNAWEIANGLNPNRYDAMEDLDGDGWTNFEEYMAGTPPNNEIYYPRPIWNTTFLYNGEVSEFYNHSLLAYSYSEKTSGVNMGGKYDGVWMQDRFKYIAETITFDNFGQAQLTGLPTPTTMMFQNNSALADVPLDKVTGYFPNFYSASLRISYGTGLLTGGPAGVQVTITYERSLGNDVHLRSGWNRFFGFIDLNNNDVYDMGEPAGLSVNQPSLVSWDAIDIDMALTDYLVGYPRIAWAAIPSNTLYNCTDHYTVTISASGNPVATVDVKKPRTFFHEGDLIAAGINGLDFGAATQVAFDFAVTHGEAVITNGTFCYNLGTTADRRIMAPQKPVQGEEVFGSNVEFQWKMDYRNEGARISIKGIDDGKTYYDGLINLPVRHGRITDDDYYYSVVPQNIDGKTYFTLPPGRYTYTIKEYVRTTSGALTKQSITEWFQVASNDEIARDIYSISGTISYFGKASMVDTRVDIYTFPGTESGFDGMIPGTNVLNPGTISVQLVKPSGEIIESMNDSNADGALLSESGSALSGGINYTTRMCNVEFADVVPVGYKLVLSYKRFLKPIILTAYKLSDSATNCFAFSGVPAARVKQYVKGHYKLEGLPPGKYAVRAFIDSDNDGNLDDWESYGVAVNGPIQGPVVYTHYLPIQLPTSQTGKDLVIRDRDTDNDLLPDAWEYQQFGSLTAKSGYDQNEPDLYIWQEYADGVLDSDPNRVDTDDDGLSDAVELRLTGTDTHEVDTDKDGISDLEEFLSGSNPLDPASAVPYKTLGIEFDAEGKPFVLCPYPALVRGIVISYILKHKEDLADAEWQTVYEPTPVSAPDVTMGMLPAGIMTMKPDSGLIEDWSKGFFKVDVQVDYGEWTIQ